MRLAVISDTHLGGPDEAFQTLYDTHLAPATFLLHCGDMVGAPVYHYLCRHPRFLSVRGNCDHFELDHDLPLTLSRELEIPGAAPSRWAWPMLGAARQRVAARVRRLARSSTALYGHTHRRHWEQHQGVWLLNPGSVAEGSMALVDVAQDGTLDCTFVDLSGSYNRRIAFWLPAPCGGTGASPRPRGAW
jgi:putative phosphoesterase